MRQPLRILLVEDSDDDAVLLLYEVRQGGYDPTFVRVETAAAMEAALDHQVWDIVIADYRLPSFSALGALAVLHQRALDLPFIIVSGKIGEETAVAAMKAGAHDYLMKDKLARLNVAIERELREAEVRRKRQQAEEDLRRARDELEIRVQERTRELQMARGRLEYLSRRLLEVQEDERRRLAQQLHDEIGQPLAALRMQLQSVQRKLADPELVSQLDPSIVLTEGLVAQVRDLFSDLRPSMLDDLGLVSTLRWYLDHTAQQTGLAVDFRADPLNDHLSPQLKTVCFRVVQEAVTNSVRYARAQALRVALGTEQGALTLRITDDGVGFDVEAALAARGTTSGLLSMQERVDLAGGKIELASRPGHGTTIDVRFALDRLPPARTHEDTAGSI